MKLNVAMKPGAVFTSLKDITTIFIMDLLLARL